MTVRSFVRRSRTSGFAGLLVPILRPDSLCLNRGRALGLDPVARASRAIAGIQASPGLRKTIKTSGTIRPGLLLFFSTDLGGSDV